MKMHQSRSTSRRLICGSPLAILATLFFAILLIGSAGFAQCAISNPQLGPANTDDALSYLLTRSGPCANSVTELRKQLFQQSVNVQSSVVNRRGQFNLASGEYQVSESIVGQVNGYPYAMAQGMLFITFPLGLAQNTVSIVPRSNPNYDSLLQAIVWDYTKGAFNFYELVRLKAKRDAQWIYNGDSFDSLKDITSIHRFPNERVFGTRNNCTACHTTGSPIMKEALPPHSNWWTTERPFLFGNLKISPEVSALGRSLVDAGYLSQNVRRGQEILSNSPAISTFARTLSLQEQLRPVFCPVEYEFESDFGVLDRGAPSIKIPSGFFVDTRILTAEVFMPSGLYLSSLLQLGASWPQIDRRDGDRAFIVPIKSHNDRLWVQRLLNERLINSEFMLDVLSVDMGNPNYSLRRCTLLNLLPPVYSPQWYDIFVGNLQLSPLRSAQELFKNLTDTTRNIQFHQARATRLIEACRARLVTGRGALDTVLRLSQTRLAAATSNVSKHPLGFIYDTAFRTLFPAFNSVIHQRFFSVDDSCQLVDEGIWVRN